MTRADLFAALELGLAPHPVVSHPLLAVMPPAFVLGGSTRTPELPTMCDIWSAEYELIGIVGRKDDTDVYDLCETLQNLVCSLAGKIPGVTSLEQRERSDLLTVGNVDYLAFRFTFENHNVA